MEILIEKIDKLQKEKERFEKNWNELEKYFIDYREAKSGYDVSGRYCVALSIDDILKIMSEIEEKNKK